MGLYYQLYYQFYFRRGIPFSPCPLMAPDTPQRARLWMWQADNSRLFHTAQDHESYVESYVGLSENVGYNIPNEIAI